MVQEQLPELHPGWTTVRRIGTGSFGAVYEIQRDLFGKTEKAALKYIHIPHSDSEIEELYGNGYNDASITAHFEDYLADIVREYSLMAEMKGHTNVVYCDDIRYIQHDDGFGWDIFIKMELLTPMMKMPVQAFSEKQVIRLGMDICRALMLCRDKNIVHRDIKPQNILVSETGDYKLGDFGIAKTVERSTGGTKTGTIPYMAPEVFNNQPYGSRADIYSLGLVMYWLMNERRLPFLPLPPRTPTAKETEEARIRRLSGEAIPAPKNGSRELKAIVLKACAFRPEDRFQTAEEMLNALSELGQKKPAPQPQPKPKPAPKPKPKPVPQPQPKPVKEGETVVEKPVPKPVRKPEPEPVPTPEPDDDTVTGKTVAVPQPETEPKPVPKPVPSPEPEPNPQPAPKPKKKMWVSAICACMAIIMLLVWFSGRNAEGVENALSDINSTAVVQGDESDVTVGTVSSEVDELDEKIIVDISVGGSGTAVLYDDGTVGMIGDPYHDVNGWEHITQISLGPNGLLALCEDGTVIRSANSDVFRLTHDWSNIKSVASGVSKQWEAGLRNDGTVVLYYNAISQSIDPGWSDVIAVAVGGSHVVALKTDGTVAAYGTDNAGACDVSGWTDIIAISAGSNHTVGLKSDGTVVAVGENREGRCEVSSWTDIVAISAGGEYTVGLKSDGTVVATGNNAYGRCDVSDWTDIVAIEAGLMHTVGLKSDGSLIAVGLNGLGQCDVEELVRN